MKAHLIPTSTAEHLIKNIPKGIKNSEVIFPELNKERKRYFPDGEIYMKIPKAEKLKGKRVIVLHSGAPGPNEGLVELELILQILRNKGAKPIEVFFTYFPYGMQDKVFEKGEANVAENLVKKLINFYRVRKIYTIDAHFGERRWVKKYPIISISAVPILVKKAEKDFGRKILFFSPDSGEKRRTGISGVKKERIDSHRVKMVVKNINLKGKIVGVVDDMIKTGGTLLKFSEIARKSGAKKIIALVTHGVMSSGVSKIKKKYSKLYLTNTINIKEANIDVTNLILNAIRNYD